MVYTEKKSFPYPTSPEALTSGQFNDIMANIDHIKSISDAPNFRTLLSSFLEQTATVDSLAKPRALIGDENISTTLYGTNYSAVSFFIRPKEEKNNNWLGNIKFCAQRRDSLVIDLFADKHIILTQESPFDENIVRKWADSSDVGDINNALQTIEEKLFIRKVGNYALNHSFDGPPRITEDMIERILI